MSIWTRGTDLSNQARHDVLNAYGYRWTVENETRARAWYKDHKSPTGPPVTDEQWLAGYEFLVRANGQLDQRAQSCRPYYLPRGGRVTYGDADGVHVIDYVTAAERVADMRRRVLVGAKVVGVELP
jgi:hypothetical protein